MGHTYLFRGIPAPLWSGARAKAEYECRPVSQVLVKLLVCYVSNDFRAFTEHRTDAGSHIGTSAHKK